MKVLGLLMTFMAAMPVLAVQIDVDGTVCSLPDAVNAASNNTAVGGCAAGGSEADVLMLVPQMTYVLTEPHDISISYGLRVNSGELIIEGRGAVVERDLNAPEFGMIQIDGSAQVTINDLTIKNGHMPSNFGGGVQVVGRSVVTTFNQVNVVDNMGMGMLFFAGGSHATQHTINNSRIGNNSSLNTIDPSFGGGISVYNSHVLINNTTIDNNNSLTSGGGLAIGQAEVTLVNSTISGNYADQNGGGILVRDDNNVVKIFNSTVVNNQAMNTGGGLDLSNDNNPTNNSYFKMYASIVAGNTAGIDADQVNGPVNGGMVLDGYNLMGNGGDAGVVNVNLGASDLVPSEMLSGIVDTLTAETNYFKRHPLVPNSPAIDFVPGTCISGFDQVGHARPFDGDNNGIFACDSGSIEFIPDLIFIHGFD